jgi:hypothetical protein
MIHTVTYSRFAPHRRTRAFFLRRTAQHVQSGDVGRELMRAVLALAGALSWGAVAILLSNA